MAVAATEDAVLLDKNDVFMSSVYTSSHTHTHTPASLLHPPKCPHFAGEVHILALTV